MRKVTVLVVLAALIIIVAVPAQAAVVFSTNPAGPNWGNCLSTTTFHAIGFTTDAQPHTLASITVEFIDLYGSNVATSYFDLYTDAGGSPGAWVATLGTVAPGGYGLFTMPTQPLVLEASTTYWIVGRADAFQCIWSADTTYVPSGVFTYVGKQVSTNGGGIWSPDDIVGYLVINDASGAAEEEEEVVEEPVPGCDVSMVVPSNAVGATITAETPVYWAPGEMSDEVFPAGLTLLALGVDESGAYTKVLYVCGYYWVPTGVIGPNYDEVWAGAPLPTDVVE